MLAVLVKFNASPLPATKPEIETVAPVRLPRLSASFTAIEPPAGATGAVLPTSYVAVVPAVMVGDACTVSRVLVATAELAVPSLIDQSMVRLVCEPPPVGSPLPGLKV